MEPASAVFPDLDLVIRPPYPPMEALAVDALPPGAQWLFAPRLCTFAQLEGGRDESLAAFWGRRAG